MLWSILLCAIPERYVTVAPLLRSLLEDQAVARIPDVELLYLMDSRRRSVGAKRNAMLSISNGEYISFIDDDDEVAVNYVQRIRDAIIAARKTDPQPDIICFPQTATLSPHGITHECTYSLAHWRDRNPSQRRVLETTDKPNVLKWSGPPAHTMVWRRATVADVRFPEIQFGEDVDWVDAACAKAKTEMRIEGQPLYFYRYSGEGTSTR